MKDDDEDNDHESEDGVMIVKWVDRIKRLELSHMHAI